jgi:hypothetical protein
MHVSPAHVRPRSFKLFPADWNGDAPVARFFLKFKISRYGGGSENP